jgi:hypothetical protein
MAKKASANKHASNWTLQIEFSGLLVAEPFFKQKKLIVHLIDDPLHVPAFTAPLNALKLAEGCAPAYTLLSGDSGSQPPTLGVWPVRRGAAMMLLPPDRPPFDLDIPYKKPKPCENQECSDSISSLANLNRLLSARRCEPNPDDPTFLLTRGRVKAARCDPKLVFHISVDGDEVFTGNLSLSLIYQLQLTNNTPVVIDLHPGKVTVGPPDDATGSERTVKTTITNFPTTQFGRDDMPHFMEYNRIAGTDFDIDVRATTSPGVRFPGDPIHCVPASLTPEV